MTTGEVANLEGEAEFAVAQLRPNELHHHPRLTTFTQVFQRDVLEREPRTGEVPKFGLFLTAAAPRQSVGRNVPPADLEPRANDVAISLR